LHLELYNSALAQKKSALEEGSKVPTFTEQCKELTSIRAQEPLLGSLNAQAEQITLKRLGNAFAKFYQRRREGKVGFPRFKSRDRFKGFGYKTYGDGWKFTPGNNLSKRPPKSTASSFSLVLAGCKPAVAPETRALPKQ